jgi:peptidoglycan/xylan/chitin deacetylase (PgdA/CDA1 family)
MRTRARLATAAAAALLCSPALIGSATPAVASTVPGCPASTGQRITDTPATYQRTVALTFDDGPGPKWTAEVLAILARHHVHGTFFVVGSRAARLPDVLQQEVDAGQAIGNHTWDHPTAGNGMYALTRQQLITELDPTSAMIRDVTGRPVCFFRAPQDKDRTATIHELAKARGLTVTSFHTASDYLQPTQLDPAWVSLIEQRLENLGNHPILLLHDGGTYRANSVAALDQIITWYASRGYVFTDPAGRPFPGDLPAGAQPPASGWAVPPDWTPPANPITAPPSGQVGARSAGGADAPTGQPSQSPAGTGGTVTGTTAPAVQPSPALTKLSTDSATDPLAAQQLMSAVARYLMVFSTPPT